MFIRQFHLLTELYKVTIPGFGFLHHVTSLIWTRGNYVKTQQTTCARFNIFYIISASTICTQRRITQEQNTDNIRTIAL